MSLDLENASLTFSRLVGGNLWSSVCPLLHLSKKVVLIHSGPERYILRIEVDNVSRHVLEKRPCNLEGLG